LKYQTIFLSDIHLGARSCHAERVLDFLSHNDADVYYLVGDIIDGYRLSNRWHWPQSHNDVVQALLAKAKSGAKIYLIPGNHDSVLRTYLGTHFGGIDVVQNADFMSLQGKRYLVTHGDQFDMLVVHAKWLSWIGDWGYETVNRINYLINKVIHLFGGRPRSLSKWAKRQLKPAQEYILKFENLLSDEARREGYDGVICGHIHSANIRDVDGIHYINTGDWVENCTAVVESFDGEIVLIDYSGLNASVGPKFKFKKPLNQKKTDRRQKARSGLTVVKKG